jgi:gamma-glutamyl hercynylcysteine S-oxide synthase
MSNKITNEDIENASVKLKPLFGIKPGIYLTVIYSIIVLVLLFFLLVFPGIRDNGVKVVTDIIPSVAAIYVDNTYMGSGLKPFFVDKGSRNFRIEKKYFETIQFEENIGGRILGSLFFPRKYMLNRKLILSDPEGFLEQRFNELSSYALITDYYDRYQMPPLISGTVSEFISGYDSEDKDMLYTFLYTMRVNLGSPDMIEDYIKAINIFNGDSDNNSSKSDLDLSVIFSFFSKENNSEGLFLSILNAYLRNDRAEILKVLSSKNLFPELLDSIYKHLKVVENLNEPRLTGEELYIMDSKFIEISSALYLAGESLTETLELLISDELLAAFPHTEKTGSFYILEKEITRSEYLSFLQKNPEWKIENKENLIKQGLVSKDYLEYQDFLDSGKPIANISWYAADAYCKWFETLLPDNLKFDVRLPKEAEWEAAARLDYSDTVNYIFRENSEDSALTSNFTRLGNAQLYDIMGNLWEWNDNWYFPADTVNGEFGLSDSNYSGAEKSVRGGSWANSHSEINISTRGSQDPTWCTPFLGFRIILVEK